MAGREGGQGGMAGYLMRQQIDSNNAICNFLHLYELVKIERLSIDPYSEISLICLVVHKIGEGAPLLEKSHIT